MQQNGVVGELYPGHSLCQTIPQKGGFFDPLQVIHTNAAKIFLKYMLEATFTHNLGMKIGVVFPTNFMGGARRSALDLIA
jgi:hypothetical protein